MAGRGLAKGCRNSGTADYKEEEHSNPVIRSFIASFDVAVIRADGHPLIVGSLFSFATSET